MNKDHYYLVNVDSIIVDNEPKNWIFHLEAHRRSPAEHTYLTINLTALPKKLQHEWVRITLMAQNNVGEYCFLKQHNYLLSQVTFLKEENWEDNIWMPHLNDIKFTFVLDVHSAYSANSNITLELQHIQPQIADKLNIFHCNLCQFVHDQISINKTKGVSNRNDLRYLPKVVHQSIHRVQQHP